MGSIHRLSSVAVRNAKPGLHADGGGLYLQATKSTDRAVTKSWVFRFATGRIVTSATGKQRAEERQMGLGSLIDVSLAEARERAAECRQLCRQGIDPIESRRAAKVERLVAAAKAMTFEQAAEAYVTAHRAGWRNPKHAAQWVTTFKGSKPGAPRPVAAVTATFNHLPVGAVDTGLILKALEPIWVVKPETANRARGRIEAVLDWAAARGFRKGENPARWRGHLDTLLPARSKLRKVKHHPALLYTELPAFLADLREQQGVAARALEYTILTAVRTNETIGAKLAEIDMTGRVWTIPAERMKAERDHRVPLSGPAVAILKRMQDVQEDMHVFPGGRRAGLSNMAMLELLRGMNERRAKRGLPKWIDPTDGREIVTHGFRSTFRTWAAERTNFPWEVAEAAIAHVVGDETEQAYQRGDLFQKRRRLMDAWAAYCAQTPETGAVIELKATVP